MYITEEFSRNETTFPRTRGWGMVYLIKRPQGQDGNLRGGECMGLQQYEM
jgi:hypothetical protein